MFITMTAPCDTSQQLLAFVLTRSENLELAALGGMGGGRGWRVDLPKAQGEEAVTGKAVGLACWKLLPRLPANSSVSGCFQVWVVGGGESAAEGFPAVIRLSNTCV